jgi:hypothetical protein
MLTTHRKLVTNLQRSWTVEQTRLEADNSALPANAVNGDVWQELPQQSNRGQAIKFPSSILIICISELTRSLLVFAAQNNLKDVRLNIHRCA